MEIKIEQEIGIKIVLGLLMIIVLKGIIKKKFIIIGWIITIKDIEKNYNIYICLIIN